MGILLVFAFLSGIITILSPCILPVLPVILEILKYQYWDNDMCSTMDRLPRDCAIVSIPRPSGLCRPWTWIKRAMVIMHDISINEEVCMKCRFLNVFVLCFITSVSMYVYGMGQASPDIPGRPDKGTVMPEELRTAVFAGGCFWGVEGVFERVKGVWDVTSGYAGGSEKTAHYDMVGTGTTGHAEAVRISYRTLLKVFFTVAHDPTQLIKNG